MAAIPGSVRVGGKIAPTDSTDTYGSHEDIYGIGGHRSVADLTERDAITTARRKEGMLVHVVSEGKLYRLIGGITNSDWVEFMGGATSTGFLDLADSAISFNELTREFSIAPTGTLYSYYIDGGEFSKNSADTIIIPDTDGEHLIYFDGSTISQTTTFSGDLYQTKLMIARVLWDATSNKAVLFLDDRHSYDLPSASHIVLHLTIGIAYESGLAIQNLITNGDGSSNTHAQLAVQNGIAYDENKKLTIADGSPQDLAPIAYLPVLYREGVSGAWRKTTANTFPFRNFVGGGGRVAYNEWTGVTWKQTEVPSTNHVLVLIMASTETGQPVAAIQGQTQYGTLAAAQNAALDLNTSFNLSGLPLSEMMTLGICILQTATAYTNTPKARFRPAASGDYVDYRNKTLEPSITTNFAPGVLSGTLNPNGSVSGQLGQSYYDSTLDIWYKCNGSTVWVVDA